MYKHIMVTGGAGFAGSALCCALRNDFPSAQITAFDNLRRRGADLNVEKLITHSVHFVHGDVRVRHDLDQVTPAPDLIIECSAEPSAQAGYGGSPDYLVSTNLTGCVHCADLARLTRADFMFVSTSRVYPYRTLNELTYSETATRFELNDGQDVPGASSHGVSEAFPLAGPKSLYGMTKLASELVVEEFADAYGFRFIINRFGLITGPGQWAKADQGVIAFWAAAHFYGKPLSYIGFGGTGKQVRDFLHVDDFCELIVDQVAHFDCYAGQRWNAGGGRANSLSLFETTSICEAITGNRLAIESRTETRPADVRVFITDFRQVNAVRGWTPKRNAQTTVSDIVTWLDAGGERLRYAIGL